jgi:phosphinothricin acetyltransferase
MPRRSREADATFETNVPTWSEWQKAHLPAHRFVALGEPKTIRGWSALSRFSERREYAGVVECYTYVRLDANGRVSAPRSSRR